MDINDLFDGIMKSINQFAFDAAEKRLQEKMLDTGRGPENRGKNAENFTLRHPWHRGLRPALRAFSRRILRLDMQAKEKRGMTSFSKME